MKVGALSFDTIEYASRANAIVGIRDSGKSYSATGFAEQLLDSKDRPGGVPITVFDPTGVWRFLRVPAKGKGYPVVVVGGVNGDLPLNPATIGKVIEGALMGSVSIVLDLSGSLTKGTIRKVVTDCVNVMMEKNAKYGLRHVFLEEAAQFVPQNIGDPQVYEAVERMVRVGGNMGLGVTMVNPRTQNLNKAVLELCDNLFIHRQKGKNSLKSLKEWFDANGLDEPADLARAVSRLKTGECFAWLRDFEEPTLVRVQQKNSFHPNRRDLQASIGSSTKRVDAGAFITTLRNSLPAIEAEVKANDPSELRKEIADLKKQLATATKARPDGTAKPDQDSEVRLRSEGYNAGWAAAMKESAKQRGAVAKWQKGIRTPAIIGAIKTALTIAQDVDGYCAAPPSLDAAELIPAKENRPPVSAGGSLAPPAKPRLPATTAAPASSDQNLGRCEKAILDALVWWKAIGFDAPSREQVGIKARYAPSSGGFRNALGALRTAGLISYPDKGQLSVTDAGEAAVDFAEVPTKEHLREALRAVIKDKCQTEIFDALYPHGANHVLTRDEIAAATPTGYSSSSGGFRNALGALRTLTIIDYKPHDSGVPGAYLRSWVFMENDQ